MPTTAVRAPLRVSRAFNPRVVPCVNSAISETDVLAFPKPSSTPRAGSAGVVGTLSKRSSPVTLSSSTTSVKVPPTSIASRPADLVVAMQFSCRSVYVAEPTHQAAG